MVVQTINIFCTGPEAGLGVSSDPIGEPAPAKRLVLSLPVSDIAVQHPPAGRQPEAGSKRATGSTDGRGLASRYAWWIVAVALVVVSVVIVLAAGARPGYDPYGWLVWGYQTWHASLNLGGAPSWKPFTYLFTVPYTLFGHYALWLWMTTAVASSLAGCIFAGRIVYRVIATSPSTVSSSSGGSARDSSFATSPSTVSSSSGGSARDSSFATSPERRWAAIAGATFAGLALLGIQDYMHYVLSVQSDPMLVAVCLAAIDCHLAGHPRWAFLLGALASLGRPEVWPFTGCYAIWAWRTIPAMRWLIGISLLAIAALWFGVPEITNHRPNIAGQLALKSPRQLHSNKVIGTIDRFTALSYFPIELAALVAVVIAAFRRNLVVLTLAAVSVLWVVVEIAFSLHGFPGVPRYLFEPAGVTAVLGGIAVGWVLADAPRLSAKLPRWSGIPVVVVLVASLLPGALARAGTEHKDLNHERARATEINRLAATISAIGGYKHLRACGRPVMNVEYVSIMAWYVKLNTGYIGYRPQFELTKTYPIVLFTSLHNGWAVHSYRVKPTLWASCSNLANALYVPTARHPNGALIER